MLLQELIDQYYRDTAQADVLPPQLPAALRAQPLLVACHPATRHPYMLLENGLPTAAVFSEPDAFERFADACADKGGRPVAETFEAEALDQWLFTLVRCGFSRIMLGYLPRSLNISIASICEIPDQRDLPLLAQSAPAARLTGSLIWLSQGIADSTATGEDTLRALREIYHAPYLVPTVHDENGFVPIALERGGKAYLAVFTDRDEWHASRLFPGAAPAIGRIATLNAYEQMGCSGVLVDPGTGIEIGLARALLDAAEQAVTGQTADMELRTLRESPEAVQITDPADVPAAMSEALTAALQTAPSVRAAWLRSIRTPASIRPHYLLVLDCGEEKPDAAFVRSLAEILHPLSEGQDIEITAAERARAFIDKAKPVYRKKRYGII